MPPRSKLRLRFLGYTVCKDPPSNYCFSSKYKSMEYLKFSSRDGVELLVSLAMYKQECEIFLYCDKLQGKL